MLQDVLDELSDRKRFLRRGVLVALVVDEAR